MRRMRFFASRNAREILRAACSTGARAMRIDADHKRYQNRCERAAENAKRRWEKENDAMRPHADDANTTSTSTPTSTTTSSSSSTSSSTATAAPASAAAMPADVENPVESYSPRSPEEFEALRQKALDRLARGMSFKSF